MRDVDERLSQEVTEALNASMPDVLRAASGNVVATMLLAASAVALAVGIVAAIFGSALPDTSWSLVVVLVVFVALTGWLVATLVIGIRAKRAFTQIAEVVQREHRATLLRVAGRRVHVRRASRT